MKLHDFAGNPLEVGDLIVVNPEHIVAQITEIESGDIVKGLVLDGKPAGQQMPPHIKFLIHMPGQTMAIPGTNVVAGVIKVVKPPEGK